MTRASDVPSAVVLLLCLGLGVSLLMLAGGLFGMVPEAAAADGPQAAPKLEPASVQSATDPFALVPPAGARCEDNGTARTGSQGWRWHSFIVEADRDLSTLEFGGTGPGTDYDATDGQITAGLIASGRGVFNEPPAEQPPGMLNPNSLAGLVLDPADFTLRDGRYLLGFVCTDEASVTRRWWSVEVTVQTAAAPFLTTGGGAAALADPTAASTATAIPSSAPSMDGAIATKSAAAPTSSEVVDGPRGVSWAPLVVITHASSALPIAVWAVLVVLLGRITYLLVRPVRVLIPIAP